MPLTVEFCGEMYRAATDSAFVIGRDGDLVIDENPYLHRRFLTLEHQHGTWFLANVGSQMSATATDGTGALQAWLAPGAQLPLVFGITELLFTAGPTTYSLTITQDDVVYHPTTQQGAGSSGGSGDTTIGPMELTLSQRQLIVALAEPLLRKDGGGMSQIPTSRDAAARLGWEQTRFNRKLDNVCDKLIRRGVRGLRGSAGDQAMNRRARLVEHAVSTRLVTAADLPVLDVQEMRGQADD